MNVASIIKTVFNAGIDTSSAAGRELSEIMSKNGNKFAKAVARGDGENFLRKAGINSTELLNDPTFMRTMTKLGDSASELKDLGRSLKAGEDISTDLYRIIDPEAGTKMGDALIRNLDDVLEHGKVTAKMADNTDYLFARASAASKNTVPSAPASVSDEVVEKLVAENAELTAKYTDLAAKHTDTLKRLDDFGSMIRSRSPVFYRAFNSLKDTPALGKVIRNLSVSTWMVGSALLGGAVADATLFDSRGAKALAEAAARGTKEFAAKFKDLAPDAYDRLTELAPEAAEHIFKVIEIPAVMMESFLIELGVDEQQAGTITSIVNQHPLLWATEMVSGKAMEGSAIAARIQDAQNHSGGVEGYLAEQLGMTPEQVALANGMLRQGGEHAQNMTPEELKELAADIKENGLPHAQTAVAQLQQTTSAALKHKNLDDWSNDAIKGTFNFVSDNTDKFGIGMMGSIGFAVVGLLANTVSSIFGASAGAAVQKFALSMFDVDDKLQDLQNGISNNEIVTTMEDRFGLGHAGATMDMGMKNLLDMVSPA